MLQTYFRLDLQVNMLIHITNQGNSRDRKKKAREVYILYYYNT